MIRNIKQKDFERLVTIVSLALGVIALFLSYQANVTASKQVEAQIVVFNVAMNPQLGGRAGGQGEEVVFCGFSLRLVNLGGATTAITSYKASISYSDVTVVFDSEGTTLASDKTKRIDDFRDFQIQLGEKMPIQIGSSADIEIPSEVRFSHSPSPVEFFWDFVEGSSPLVVRYIFSLASGKEIQSPKATCLYIK
ncbi:MAG: hypothetical protein KGJ80_09270 [Chloroflexota bacterium]|nr:hypothetical protein [Chloroflexota bacterium]